eukprot:COSAG06_NODE_22226_length_730_cov_1.096672_1_plen_96_part_00
MGGDVVDDEGSEQKSQQGGQRLCTPTVVARDGAKLQLCLVDFVENPVRRNSEGLACARVEAFESFLEELSRPFRQRSRRLLRKDPARRATMLAEG